MTRPATRALGRLGALIVATLIAVAVAGAVAVPAGAHSPDPLVGGKNWAPDQVVAYGWTSAQLPPAWAATAIDAAAADVGESRASRAATFVRNTAATSSIAYGEPTGCSPAGIACFDRSGAPTGFKMWFRAHGYQFDWGTLRWCQGLAEVANGCFDLENIALDEFGHVENLGHHVNFGDGSDYLDAVVQTVSRARPKAGWDRHALARCDVARLQLEYERARASDLFSTCLELTSVLTLGASSTSISTGQTILFSGTLRVANDLSSRSLANDPVSARQVQLQRRPVGATSWTAIVAMTPSPTTAGLYTAAYSPTATYEWRAVFVSSPSVEGLAGDDSAILKVTVNSGCYGSGCPQSAPRRP